MPGVSEIDQVGKREDLSDVIAVADMKQTPFTSRIRKGAKPTNTHFEWQVDSYDAANTNGTVAGADVTTFENAAKNRQRLGGRIQKFRRTVMVDDLAENVSVVAGVDSEMARAKAKKSVEIKRDMEAAFLSDNDSQQDNGVLPYLTRGMGKWISSTAQTDLPVAAAYLTPANSIWSGALTSFGEDQLRGVLQSRFEQTGMSDELVLFCGTNLKKTISDFTRYEPTKASNTQLRRFENDDPTTISTTVDFYESDFGGIEISEPDLFLPDNNRGYAVDMRMVEMRVNRAPGYRDLPDLGGGPRGLIDCIVGLACLNPLAHGKILGS